MRTFNEYAEKAIERYGLTGYNNLARELNMNKATVSYFRSGKALPSEATMIKLAELAGLPKEEALIDLNLWRSKNNRNCGYFMHNFKRRNKQLQYSKQYH